MQDTIEPRHVLELQAKLGGKVNWNKFSPSNIQGVIETPRLSGAHFEEFLRQGGRVSLDYLPIKIAGTYAIKHETGSWEDMTREAPFLAETVDVGHGYGIYGRGFEYIKPRDWQPKGPREIVIFEIRGNEPISQQRLLECFALFDTYPVTVPELLNLLWQERLVLADGKEDGIRMGLVALNAVENNTYKNISNIRITQPDINKFKYKFEPIGGDIEDLGVWDWRHEFVAAKY